MKRLALLLVLTASSPALAQINMPDPSQIAGRALPAPELADGTVSVRVVRESLGNNVTGHEVTVIAGDVTRTSRTDESGRAQVTGLPAGRTATAETVVDGERVVSLPFEVPSSGGLRVILISGLEQARARRAKEEAEAAKAPPAKGSVVLGSDSRLIFEFQNDRLSAFYMLDIVNTARTRVDTGGPLIVDLPEGAGGTRIMQGSFAGASAKGDRVTITGPFPSGTSSVQIGFQVLYSGATTTVRQRFPVPLQRLAVFAEKIGSLEIASPQFAEHGEVKAGDGTLFLSASGGAVAAGTEVAIHFTNLPHRSTWPRNVALALAAGFIGLGTWLAFQRGNSDHERQALTSQRDALLAELARLESQHRAGRVADDRYDTRRTQLLADLERIYDELDDRSAESADLPAGTDPSGRGATRPGEGGGAAA